MDGRKGCRSKLYRNHIAAPTKGAAATASAFQPLRWPAASIVTVYDVQEIDEWIDGGQTALRRHCGIDSVLSVIDGKPDVVFLWVMHCYWF
jgi:hypothetical protein